MHIFIGHGESDKGSSSSNQLRAYDYALAAGEASKRRMEGIRFFDTAERVIAVGRPQADDMNQPLAPDTVRAWQGDGIPIVLYAPTWEGDRPSMAYGSAASHGRALVDAILADGRFHLIFRPHPSSGTVSRSYRTAVAEIAAKVQRSGTKNYADGTAYGWQLDAADYLITDVSAVAYDWLAQDKPMLVTLPASDAVHREESDLLAAVPGIEATSAINVVDVLTAAEDQRDPNSPLHADLERLRDEYFGDRSPGAATRRFVSAVTQLSGLGTAGRTANG
nr:CDP-glycerol glycerophosphotransferase family protein [Spelaeicoccus albus]